jgi:hypothetical protein
MPYCYQHLKKNHAVPIESIVKLLAKEQFHARDAYPLEKTNQFNIDGSMNDVRAITDNQFIRLFCRYKKDVQRMSQRLIKFVDSHPDICGVFDEEDTGETESITFNLTCK